MHEDPSLPQNLPRIYSGVLADGWCLGFACGAEGFWLSLFDLPLSLAADTVFLPFKAYEQIRYGNFHPRLVPEVHAENERNRERLRAEHLSTCRAAIKSDGGWWSDHPRQLEQCRKDLATEATDGGSSDAGF